MTPIIMQPHDASSRSAPIFAARSILISLLACSACGPKPDPGTTNDTSTTSTTSDPATSTNQPTVAQTVTSLDTSPSTSESSSSTSGGGFPGFDCGFAVGNEGRPRCSSIGDCDVFKQNCPPGEKCAAVITDGGGAWNDSRCVPVTGDDVAGEPCTAESVANGLDSCAKGNMCWQVDDMGNGTCVELCMGTVDAPVCPDMGFCTIANDDVLNLCLPDCDPVLQDCADPSQACYPIDDRFTCAWESRETGTANDPCMFVDECEAGFLCGDPAFVGAGCPEGSPGCCTPFCAFPDGPCPNPDQQ